MADNVTLNSGSGGVDLATEDEGSVHYQKIKLTASGSGTTADLSHAEDTAHTTGDHGLMGLTVRSNTAASTSGTDGDYQPLITDTNGRLHTIDVSTAAALSGSEFQVDVVAALPAGTNAIGKLSANSGVDIGDVDVTSVAPGTGASSLGKAEDSAHSSADVGVMGLSVRQDTAAATSGTDGDYQPLITDANGRLHSNDVSTAAALSGSEFQVDVVAALPAGTNAIGKLSANSGVDIGDVDILSVIPGVGATNLGKAEDAAHSSGDVGVAAMTVRANTAVALSGADNDYQPLITDTNGRLHSNDVSTAAALSGSEFQVDVVASLPAGTNAIGKLSANSGVDIGDVDVTTIAAGATLIGDVGISGARTAGGTTMYRNVDVDETEDAVKASAGQIYWIMATNLDATPVYLHFYNLGTGSVTVGTTTPDLTFVVPTQGDSNGAGFTLSIPNGIEFDTAITIAAATTVGGAGGPGTNEVLVNLGFA